MIGRKMLGVNIKKRGTTEEKQCSRQEPVKKMEHGRSICVLPTCSGSISYMLHGWNANGAPLLFPRHDSPTPESHVLTFQCRLIRSLTLA